MKKKAIVLLALITGLLWLQPLIPCVTLAEQIKLPSALSLKSSLSVEELKQQRSSIDGRSDIDGKTKTDSIKNIDQAIGFLEAAVSIKKNAMEVSQLIQGAPARLKHLHDIQKQNLMANKKSKRHDASLSTSQIEQLYHQKETQFTQAQAQLKKWNDRLTAQQAFIIRDSDQVLASANRLKEIRTELAQLAEIPGNDLVNITRKISLNAEQLKLNAENELNGQRQRGHNILLELFRGERDVLERTVEQNTALLQEISAAVQQRRTQEAVQAREDAQNAIHQLNLQPRQIQNQFDINVKIGAELEQITREESTLVQKLQAYQSRIKTIEDEYETAKRRVALDVLTDVIGMALRSQRMNLPSPNQYNINSKAHQVRMSEISERQIELDKLLRDISNPDILINELASALDNLKEKDRKELKLKIQQLITDRHDYIQKAKSGYERIIKLIQDIEFSKKRLIDTSEAFGELLDRHLLWIQSSKPFNINDVKNLKFLLTEMSHPIFWAEKIKSIVNDIQTHFIVWSMGIGIGICLLFSVPWAKKNINEIADAVNRQNGDVFLLTVKALGLTLLLSSVLPYLLLFPAMQSSLFSHVNHTALINYCGIMIFLILVYNICRPFGLAQIHFGWPEYVRTTLRRHLSWLITVEAAGTLVFLAMDGMSAYDHQHSLGKVAMMIQCMALGLFGALVFRFKKGITSILIEKYPHTWACRLRYIWYTLSFLIPLYILMLSMTGYYYSAVEIRYLFYKTAALFFALIVINDLMLRLLLIARRHIAFKKTVEKRRIKEKTSKAPISDTVADGRLTSIPETIAQLNNIDEQTRSILKLVIFVLGLMGTWAIWNSVFPAFGILQDIQLWSYQTVSNGVEKTVPITLANIVLAIIITITMFVAVRNLPGLIEVILLSRLPMDAGARYAYTTVSRYVIIAVGIFIALNSIGIRWANLQWLVAALSVGLGFGLQEIVANFISGLIVLFERPFRVGDTVTVGDVNGTVTRIQIRATTIEDWDRKELIVPNKEFIIGKIINWSLSDQVIRIKVPVGIAYGSDTDLAEDLLLRAAMDNEYALKTPIPTVVFLKFGDNSLDFEIRVFINSIDHWIPLVHSLNKTINKTFEKHNITIAFPQRDVHLDASKPLPIQMVPNPDMS